MTMPLTWPANFRPVSSEFFLEHNTTIFASPITRSQQVLRRQGERWRFAFELQPMYRRDGQALDALLAKLKGAYETVLLWNFERPYPLGDNRDRSSIEETFFDDDTGFDDGTGFSGGDAEVVVSGAHAMGATEIDTMGWLREISGILLAGDYIGIDGRLYMLTDDADSDDENHAVLKIAPPLKAAVEDGAVVTRARPTAEFRLIDDGQPNRRVAGLIYSFSLKFVEAQ